MNDKQDVLSKNPDLYVELMKKTLSFSLWPEPPIPIDTFNDGRPFIKRIAVRAISGFLKSVGLQLVKPNNCTKHQREEAKIWPLHAETMIGFKRLDNLKFCVETAIKENIEGDFIETGVWRGGACIFMRAILAAHDIGDRKVYVADSFNGLPKPDVNSFPADKGDMHHAQKFLAVSQEQVENNFAKYGLLDEQVVFLNGWFKDTLPHAPIKKLAVLRLDGDMYGSTMDALTSLYSKLSPGGFCIVDDYNDIKGCKKAVDDFRAMHGITEEIKTIDWAAVYWRKSI